MKSNNYKFLSLGMAFFTAILACSLPPLQPKRASVTVNTTADTFDGKCTEDDCSLRDAVYAANHTNGLEEIILPGGLYLLDQEVFYPGDDTGIYGDLDIFSHMVIIGGSETETVIDGRRRDRIFHVMEGGSLELQNMKLYNGSGDDNDPGIGTSGGCDTFDIFCGELTIDKPSDYEHVVDEFGGGIIANRGYLFLTNVDLMYGVANNWGGGGLLNLGEAQIKEGCICNNKGNSGGGIYNLGTLTFEHSTTGSGIQSNTAYYGGGIYNRAEGQITSIEGYISYNTAYEWGGAVVNYGLFTVRDLRAMFNTAPSAGFAYNYGNLTLEGKNKFGSISATEGGVIVNTEEGKAYLHRMDIGSNKSLYSIVNSGEFVLSRSIVSGGQDGAINSYGESSKFTVVNTLITENQDGNNHNTFTIWGGGEAILTNVTIARNETPGLSIDSSAKVSSINGLFADNSGNNCIGTGTLTSLGYNLDSGNSCGLNTIGDLPSTPALLESIPPFYPPLHNSPAIDSGNNDKCPPRDFWGETRPSGLGCDIGALEFPGDTPGNPLESEDDIQDEVQNPDPEAELPDPEPIVEYWADPIEINAGGCTTFYWHVENVKSIIFGNFERDFDGTDKDCMCKTQTYPLTVNYLDSTQEKKFVTINVTGTCAPEAPEAEQSASLSGFVWKDGDANGSQEGGEDGIPGITINLGNGSCSSTGYTTSITGGNGGFSFDNLPTGEYCVSVLVVEQCKAYSVATTNTQYSIDLNPGDNKTRSFGFKKKLCD